MFRAERRYYRETNRSSLTSPVPLLDRVRKSVRILIRVARGGDPDESRQFDPAGTTTVVAPNEGLEGAFHATAGGLLRRSRAAGRSPVGVYGVG